MASGVKYPGASATPFYIARSEICVNNKGECVGNGLFAGDNFDAGTHIFAVRRPLVGSLDPVRLQDTCANCYTWTEGSTIGSRLYVKEGTKVDACTGCRRFKYCSKVLQTLFERECVSNNSIRHVRKKLGNARISMSVRT
jgi:SET and MYND domain-containing protein